MMGKTARKPAASVKRTSTNAHRLKPKVQKTELKAKNRKPSKDTKRDAIAFLEGDKVSRTTEKLSKPKLQRAVLNASKDVQRRTRSCVSSKKGTAESETKESRNKTHAKRDPCTETATEKVKSLSPAAECIWEVNPSSSDDELQDATPSPSKNLTKDSVTEASPQSEKTAIHNSPSITVVDLGTDFKSGKRQTVSLAQTKRGKRKKNWESFPRYPHKQDDPLHPETRKLWTSMEDVLVRGDNTESFVSEEKPMQSVFIVDLGVYQSRGDYSNAPPRLEKSSESTLNARSTSKTVSAETSRQGCESVSNDLNQQRDQVQKHQDTTEDVGQQRDQVQKQRDQVQKHQDTTEDVGQAAHKKGKRREARTSSKKDLKKLRRGYPLKNGSSSEDDIETHAVSSSAKKAVRKEMQAKEEIPEGSLMRQTAILSNETGQKVEGNDRPLGDKQDEVIQSDSNGNRAVAHNPPGTGKESTVVCRLEPALDVTTEDAVNSVDDNGQSSESLLDERKGNVDPNPVDPPLQDEMECADEVQTQPSYRIITLTKSGQCLLLLQHPSKFAFHGRVLVRAIHGGVLVLGFPISAGDADPTFYPLYSPSSSCALCLETLPRCPGNAGGETSCRSLAQRLEAFLGAEDESASSVPGLEEFSVALILKKMPEDHAVAYVECFPGFGNLFSSPEAREPQYTQPDESWSSNLAAAATVGIQPLAPRTPGAVFDTLTGYRIVTQSVTAWHRASHFPTVVLVCGWKNTGKSMLCRYLTNSLLSSVLNVCYLECDMAQTEFTAPGILSLHCISGPLLGPPFTHPTNAEKMCFYGDVHVRSNPESYLQMVKYLLQQYLTRHTDKPLIINTMGWMQGLGLQLLIDIIHLARPTHLVHLRSRVQPGVIPRLTPEFLDQTEGWWHRPADDRNEGGFGEARGGAFCPEILEVDVPNVGDQAGTKFKATDHRTMALLACLSKLQPSPTTPEPVALSSLTPLVLPWKSVAVHVTNGHVAPRQVMYALNGCIVGLCHADPSLMLSLSEDLPCFFDSPPICNCLGLGIVRGIDPIQKVFYVLTGVPHDALREVNTILKGSLFLPQQLLTQGQLVRDVPYVTREFSSVIIGSSAIKVRRNIKQRGR